MALMLYNRLLAYTRPMILVAIGAYCAFLVCLEVVTLQTSLSVLLDMEKFKEEVFGKVWLRMDKRFAEADLLTELPSLLATAVRGVVVELGPGSGSHLPCVDPSKITHIYGIEPCAALHPALRAQIKACGLSDKYTLVPCGVDDLTGDGVRGLEGYGVRVGEVDTVLSVQVLCSVERPAVVCAWLYGLLKEGGQMVVWEHVRSRDFWTRGVQRLYNVVWPYAMGNCNLTRPIGKNILGAGQWAEIDLHMPKDEDAWMVLPRVWGRSVKGSKHGD